MRFFEPTKSWLTWLAGYAGDRLVFDVGCGEGHLIRELHARRVKAIGIEPLWQASRENLDIISAVIPAMAEECRVLTLAADALVLFCRPCHSDFVDKTIRRLRNDAEVLYISKPENVERDINLADFDVEQLKTPKCPEERVYRVVRHSDLPVSRRTSLADRSPQGCGLARRKTRRQTVV